MSTSGGQPSAARAHPLRIIAITARADVGGGPEHLYRLLAHLGPDVDATVVAPRQEPYWTRLQSLPSVAEMIEIEPRAFRLSTLRRLRRAVSAGRFHLIHSHGKGAGLYGRLLGATTTTPAVHTFHGLHIGEYSRVKQRAYLALEWLLGRTTATAIAVSEGEAAQLAQRRLVPAARLVTIRNGVDIPVRPATRTRNTGAPLQIVTASRFDVQKNFDGALDIFSELSSDRGIDFRATVLGDGPGMAQARDAVTTRQLGDTVRLMGNVARPRDHYRAADVYLSTSLWEGMPLALLEAMSEGLPAVVTDVVGNREAIQHRGNGFLYPAHDAVAAATALVEMRDPALRRSMGRAAARSVAEDFGISTMAARTLGVYQDCAHR
ncbi:MAG: glycosyltransferase [Actinomycetota bacterium]